MLLEADDDVPGGTEAVARAQTAALSSTAGLDQAVGTVAAWARTAPAGLVELHLGRWAADRRAALRLLAVRSVALAGEDARRALVALLGADRRRDVRRHAAAEFVTLADLRRPDDLEWLRALLREPDDALAAGVAEQLVARVAAWDGTGNLSSGDDSLRELLAPLLASRVVKARTAVMRGLGGWRPGSPLSLPEAVAQLTDGLEDEAVTVRQAAVQALAQLAGTVPAQGWALVRRLHAEASPRTRVLLERHCITGALGGGLTRDEAWSWATEPAQRTRRALALALAAADLGPAGPNWHRDLLRHLSVDPVPAVRAAALDAARAFAAEAWAARAARHNQGAANPAVAEAAERLAKAVRTRPSRQKGG